MFIGLLTFFGFIIVVCFIVLWVKNMFSRIRFRNVCLRMNFMFIVGSIGSGKTALSVYINNMFYKASKSKRKKFAFQRASSFPIDLPDQRIFNYNELFLNNFDLKTPVNTLITLDEIQFFHVGSDIKKNRSFHKPVAQFISIMRHNDNKAIFVGQRLNDLWIELRDRVNLFVYCIEFKRLWYFPFLWRFSFFYTFNESLFQDLMKKYAIDGVSFSHLFTSKGAVDSGYQKLYTFGRFLNKYDSKHLAFVVAEKNLNSSKQRKFFYDDKYSTYSTVSKAGYFELIPLLDEISDIKKSKDKKIKVNFDDDIKV